MLFLFKGVAGENGTGTTVKQYENKTYPNITAHINQNSTAEDTGCDFRNSINHHSRRSQNCDKTLFG